VKYLVINDSRDMRTCLCTALRINSQCRQAGHKLPSFQGWYNVCLLLNGTSALFRPLVPRIVEIKQMRQVTGKQWVTDVEDMKVTSSAAMHYPHIQCSIRSLQDLQTQGY